MLRMALTVWEDRISPVFDAANTLLIVDIVNKKGKNRRFISLSSMEPSLLLERLIEQDVTVLICGAISEFPSNLIENSPIKLIPFISGNVEKILARFSLGTPLPESFFMPGCGCRGNRCKRQGSAGFNRDIQGQNRYGVRKIKMR